MWMNISWILQRELLLSSTGASTKGYFEDKKIDNYRKVIFHCDEGTSGQKVSILLKMGDGLGNVVYKKLYVDGIGTTLLPEPLRQNLQIWLHR